MPENAKTQSWVMKTVWQWIPGRRDHNSETLTAITVHSIPRNDHLQCFRLWTNGHIFYAKGIVLSVWQNYVY